MKKNILLIISLLILPLCGCNNKQYTSFKQYVETVKSAKEEDKNIFIFTASNCSHCKKIMPLVEQYKNEVSDVNIYILSVDYNKFSTNNKYKDETMGYLSGSSENDCIKRLDNRITSYVVSQSIIPSPNGLIYISSSQRYSYTVTPLMLFYLGNIEVKIINNVSKNLLKDDNGNIIYDSFKELMAYPKEKPNWNIPFELTYYEK